MTEDELRAIEARIADARKSARIRGHNDACVTLSCDTADAVVAALREAWERAEVAEFGERTERALNKERAAGWSEATAEYERRIAAAEADCKRLQDEVAALDAARREAEADLAGERGEYQRHSQGHMDRALAAEAAAAAMREALEQQAVQVTDDGDDEAIPVRCLYECALCLAEGPTRKAIVHASSCTLASPTPGAALLAERDRLREALGRIDDLFPKRLSEVADRLHLLIAIEDIARAALKETRNG